MTRRARPRVSRDKRGTTIAEFAVVLPVMMMIIMGLLDLCYKEYAIAMLQGSVQKAARDSSLQTGATNATALDTSVRTLFKQINNTLPNSAFTFTRRNFSDFSPAGLIEPSTGPGGRCRPPVIGPPAVSYTFTDWNNNGIWDDGAVAGVGGAQDVVLYTVTVQYDSLFPIGTLIGMSPQQTVSATTVLRNQPYANQAVRTQGTTAVACPLTSSYY